MTHVFFGKNQFFDACPTPTTATMSLGTTLPYSLIFHSSNLDHTHEISPANSNFFLMVYALKHAKTPIPIPRRGQGTLRVVSFCAPCAVANLEFISSTWIPAKMIPTNHRAYIGFDVGRIHESLDLSRFPFHIYIYIF